MFAASSSQQPGDTSLLWAQVAGCCPTHIAFTSGVQVAVSVTRSGSVSAGPVGPADFCPLRASSMRLPCPSSEVQQRPAGPFCAGTAPRRRSQMRFPCSGAQPSRAGLVRSPAAHPLLRADASAPARNNGNITGGVSPPHRPHFGSGACSPHQQQHAWDAQSHQTSLITGPALVPRLRPALL